MLVKCIVGVFFVVLLGGCAVPAMPVIPVIPVTPVMPQQKTVTLTSEQKHDLLVEANDFCKPVTEKKKEALRSLKKAEDVEPVPETSLLQVVSKDYVTDKEFQRNARAFALYQDKPLSYSKSFKDYIQGIFQKLVEVSPNPEIDIQLVFYRKGILPASFPGGVIALDEQFFKKLHDEDQVAFILAHELSHRLLEHREKTAHYADSVVNKIESAYNFFEAVWSGGSANSSDGSFSNSLGALVVSRFLVPYYSRIEETEADRLGLDILVRAGYSPTKIVPLLRALSETHLRRLEKRIDEDHLICVAERYTKKEEKLIQELSCKKDDLCFSLPSVGIADALDDALDKERLELERHVEDLQEYYFPPNARVKSYTDYKKAFYADHKFAKAKRSAIHAKKLSKPVRPPASLSELQQADDFTLPAAFSVAEAYAKKGKIPEAEKTITYINEHFSQSPVIQPFIAGFTREHGSKSDYLGALSSCVQDSSGSFHVHPMMCYIGSLDEINDAENVVERFREMLSRSQVSY